MEKPSESESNPFAAPEADPGRSGDVAGAAEAEGIRRQHIDHEVCAKGLGGCFLWAGGYAALAAWGMAYRPGPIAGKPLAIIAPVVAALLLAIGLGLRMLQSWARWAAMLPLGGVLVFVVYFIGEEQIRLMRSDQQWWQRVISILLVVASTGLLVGLMCFLASPKTGVVFTRSYREVIRQTPNIKP